MAMVRTKREPPTDPQRREAQRLTAMRASLKELCAQSLAVLDAIKPNAIDALGSKSDFELGRETLLRKSKR